MKAVHLSTVNTANRREGDESSHPRPTALGTALLFVRSISPFYIPETNQAAAAIEPPVDNRTMVTGPASTLAFVHQTTSVAQVASMILGLPPEVTGLLGSVAAFSGVGEVVSGLSRYVLNQSVSSQSVARGDVASGNGLSVPEDQDVASSSSETTEDDNDDDVRDGMLALGDQ